MPPLTRSMNRLFSILILSSTTFALAQSGQDFALGLDGVNDFVSVPHTNALNAFPLTVTAWFRAANTNAQGGLLTKFRFTPVLARGGWQLSLSSGDIYA